MSSPAAVDDLTSALELLANDPCTDLDQVVIVDESLKYPGTLKFTPFDGDRQGFLDWYGPEQWISRYLILSEHYMWAPFTERLLDDGWTVLPAPTARRMLQDYGRWSEPLKIENFTCPNGGELRPYQTFCLQRAFERNRARKPADRLTVPGWCAGAGKSLFATAGAQELFNRGEIDLVLAFTLQRHKFNLCDFFEDTTELNAIVPEGDKAKRKRAYARARTLTGQHPDDAHSASAGEGLDVFVLNYDKCRHDFDDLHEITAGKRVLFALDEVQKVLSYSHSNQARKGLDNLIRDCKATVWPMTASIVGSNPLRYRSAFALSQSRNNPLGSIEDFEQRYLEKDGAGRPKKSTYERRGLNGGTFYVTDYSWDMAALHEIRHRVADRVQNARKADPGIKEYFPPLQVLEVPIQMSPEDRKLTDVVVQLAKEARKAGESLAPYYLMYRYIANTPEVLANSNSPIARFLCHEYPELITSKNSAKLEYFLDQVESIADAGDKVIAFTHWTHMGLFVLSRELTKREIKHTVHYGTGQNEKDSQKAQKLFKEDPEITLFLTSDAGAYCLNFQEARYCIQYEVPYSYDDYQQRINRIHRSDSTLTGLTAYNYVTEDSIEERIAWVCEQRRQLAEATLGTRETVAHDVDIPSPSLQALLDPELDAKINRPEEMNYDWMLFGEEE